MSMSRKAFCVSLAGSTVVVWLQGCGGGGGYSSGSSSGMTCGASGGEISGNHGHALVIAKADLDSPTAKNYSITGSADHGHDVTFSPAQLAQLKGGATVAVASTSGASAAYPAHIHTVMAMVQPSCP